MDGALQIAVLEDEKSAPKHGEQYEPYHPDFVSEWNVRIEPEKGTAKLVFHKAGQPIEPKAARNDQEIGG